MSNEYLCGVSAGMNDQQFCQCEDWQPARCPYPSGQNRIEWLAGYNSVQPIQEKKVA